MADSIRSTIRIIQRSEPHPGPYHDHRCPRRRMPAQRSWEVSASDRLNMTPALYPRRPAGAYLLHVSFHGENRLAASNKRPIGMPANRGWWSHDTGTMQSAAFRAAGHPSLGLSERGYR